MRRLYDEDVLLGYCIVCIYLEDFDCDFIDFRGLFFYDII